jgi:hypothetical protein
MTGLSLFDAVFHSQLPHDVYMISGTSLKLGGAHIGFTGVRFSILKQKLSKSCHVSFNMTTLQGVSQLCPLNARPARACLCTCLSRRPLCSAAAEDRMAALPPPAVWSIEHRVRSAKRTGSSESKTSMLLGPGQVTPKDRVMHRQVAHRSRGR